MEHNDYDDGYSDGRAIGYRNGMVEIMTRMIIMEVSKECVITDELVETIATDWAMHFRKTVLYDVTLDMVSLAIIGVKEQLDI